MIFATPNAVVGFTIYERPRDYPDKFVIRKWVVIPGAPNPVHDPDCRLADSLEAARALIPRGMYRLPRDFADDKCIAEVWV